MADVQVSIGADTTQLEAGLRRGATGLAAFKSEIKGIRSLSQIGVGLAGGFGTLGLISQLTSFVNEFQKGLDERRGSAFRGQFGKGTLGEEFAASATGSRGQLFAGLGDILTTSILGYKALGAAVLGTADDMQKAREDIRLFGQALNGGVEASEGWIDNMKALATQQIGARDAAFAQAGSLVARINRPGSAYSSREAVEFLEAVRAMKDAASMLKAVALARENVGAGRALGAPRDAAARSASLAP